jgi:hypothetical protein
MRIRPRLFISVLLVLAGCQSLSPLPQADSSCPFDEVWDTAIASLQGAQLQSADKANGLVETAWLEVDSRSRAGLVQRNIAKERVKYLIRVKPEGSGTRAAVQQLREAWSPMGVRMRQWQAMPADAGEETAVAAEIQRRLREKGC